MLTDRDLLSYKAYGIKKLNALKTISAATAGMLLITLGGMMPSSIIVINQSFKLEVFDLPSSWQVPVLILTGIVCGKESGLIAVVAYITLGLFYLPVFHGGGSVGYLATPEFGYIAGFIPAIWVIARIIEINKRNSLTQLFIATFIGLTIIHTIGILNLIIGSLTNRWSKEFIELIITYSIATFPVQLLLCPTVAILGKSIRKILIRE